MTVLVALALVGVLFLGSPAQAAMKLSLSDPSCSPGCDKIITDNGGGDTSPWGGEILFLSALSGPIGPNFTANVTTGHSKPIVGPGQLNLVSFDVASTGSGTLVLKLTDTDFNTPTGLLDLLQKLTLNSLTGNVTVTAVGYQDPGNAEFGMTNATGPAVLNHAPTGITAASGGINFAAPYSLTEVVTIVFTGGGGNLDMTANLSEVPEPASVALLGGILLITFSGIRRRMSRRA
jgi:hypothetical protein